MARNGYCRAGFPGATPEEVKRPGQVPSMLHMVFDKYDELEDSVGRKDGFWKNVLDPGNTRIFLFNVELEGYPPNIPRKIAGLIPGYCDVTMMVNY